MGLEGVSWDTPLTVDFAAVCDADDEDADPAVLDVGNEAVVADEVLPEVAELGAFESFADAAWVV